MYIYKLQAGEAEYTDGTKVSHTMVWAVFIWLSSIKGSIQIDEVSLDDTKICPLKVGTI